MRYTIRKCKRYESAAKQAWKFYSDSIFPTEEDFLHHLFFVNGNGYEWEDGNLTCMTYTTWNDRLRQPPMSFEEWRAGKADRIIYPICQYADAVNFPDNIQWDWRAALIRAVHWAETCSHEQKYWSEERRAIATYNHEEEDHKWLRQIRQRLGLEGEP